MAAWELCTPLGGAQRNLDLAVDVLVPSGRGQPPGYVPGA